MGHKVQETLRKEEKWWRVRTRQTFRSLLKRLKKTAALVIFMKFEK